MTLFCRGNCRQYCQHRSPGEHYEPWEFNLLCKRRVVCWSIVAGRGQLSLSLGTIATPVVSHCCGVCKFWPTTEYGYHAQTCEKYMAQNIVPSQIPYGVAFEKLNKKNARYEQVISSAASTQVRKVKHMPVLIRSLPCYPLTPNYQRLRCYRSWADDLGTSWTKRTKSMSLSLPLWSQRNPAMHSWHTSLVFCVSQRSHMLYENINAQVKHQPCSE